MGGGTRITVGETQRQMEDLRVRRTQRIGGSTRITAESDEEEPEELE